MANFLDFLPLVFQDVDTIRSRVNADLNAGVADTDPEYVDVTEGGFAWDMTQAPILEIERLWDFLANEVPAAMFVAYAWGDYLDLHGEIVNITRKDATQAAGRLRFIGADGTVVPTGTQSLQPAPTPDADPVAFVTTAGGTIAGGLVDLPIQAALAGSAGNVAAATITVVPDLDGVTAVTNLAALTGGSDVEDDDSYRNRILLEYQAVKGGGTIGDYRRWCLAHDGVGFVTVEPITDYDGTTPAPGKVRCTITDPLNKPCTDTVVNAVQDDIDPPALKTIAAGANQVLPVTTLTVGSTVGFDSAGGTVRWKTQQIAYTAKTGTTFTGCTGGTGTIVAGDRIAQHFDQGHGKAPIGHTVAIQTVALLTINVVATVSLEDGYSLTGSDGNIAVQPKVATALQRYIDHLNPGDDVVLGKVEAQFFRVAGIYDVTALTLNGSAANVAVSMQQVASTGTVTLTAV